MEDKASRRTDDELLSAYIDGELPDAAADALTERLAAEPRLMRRLEALRSTDAAVRGVYAQLDETPLPASLLGLFDAPQSERPADNVVAFPARGIRRFFEAPVAIAASVALVAGFFAATLVRQGPPSPVPGDALVAGPVPGDTALHELLESAPGGEVRELSGRPAEVLLTFEDAAGDWCRQLRIGMPERSIHGIACRRDATWQLETIALGDAGAPGGQYGTAAGATPPAIQSAVDALIGDASPLEAEEESVVISGGWKESTD